MNANPFLEKITKYLQADKKRSLFIVTIASILTIVIIGSSILVIVLTGGVTTNQSKNSSNGNNESLNATSDNSTNGSTDNGTGTGSSGSGSYVAKVTPHSSQSAAIPDDKIYVRGIKTQFETEDIPLISASVLDFGANPNDQNDDSDAIQDAINKTYSKLGGGTVYLPAGKYIIRKSISIMPNIRVRGEWKTPSAGSITQGTVIYAYYGENDEEGVSLFQVGEAAAITNLTVYYPDQKIGSVTPYAPTFGNSAVLGSQYYNLTLINSYKGFKIQGHNAFNVKNIYGTALQSGVYIDMVADICRLENVNFNSTFWSMFDKSVSADKVRTYTRNNLKGFTYGRCDWAYVYDCTVRDANKGFFFTSTTNGQPNGQLSFVTIENCVTGIDIDDSSNIGVQVSNSTIKATGTDSIAIKAGNDFGSNDTFMFNNCTISSEGTGALNETNGVLMFTFCTFEKWGTSKFAVDAKEGAIITDNCKFNNTTNPLFFASRIDAAIVAGNTFTGTPSIQNLSGKRAVIDFTQGTGVVKNTMPKPVVPKRMNPSKTTFYNVSDYGIVAGEDISGAIQGALNDAQKNGGGIVYIPSGRYKVDNPITVPTGVELRGINEFSKHFGVTKKGTVLETSFGKGNANGKAFITLSANSGISGFAVFYPDQHYKDNVVYSPTIQSGGDGFWIYNVNTPNSYNSVKVTHSGFHIDYLRGLGLNTCISFENVKSGFVEDFMVSGGDWQDGKKEKNAPPGDLWKNFPNYENTAIRLTNSNGIVFFQGFSFGMGTGVEILGTSSNNMFYGHGVDAARTAVLLKGSGTGNTFMNAELVAADNYIKSSAEFNGSASFYNANSWMKGNTASVTIDGTGTINLQQYKQMTGKITLVAGKTNIQNLFLHSLSPEIIVEQNAKNSSITNSLMLGLGFNIEDKTGGNIITKNNNAK
jgi:hypothetical protein